MERGRPPFALREKQPNVSGTGFVLRLAVARTAGHALRACGGTSPAPPGRTVVDMRTRARVRILTV